MSVVSPGTTKEDSVYKDDNGDWRFKDSDQLVSRINCFKNLEVHHIDGNKNNNQSFNLIACTPAQHRGIHAQIDLLKQLIKELEEIGKWQMMTKYTSKW